MLRELKRITHWDGFFWAPKTYAKIMGKKIFTILRWNFLLRVRNRNITFLFFIQNICFGCSKEPSQWDCSFEHPKHMLYIMGKKILIILRWKFLIKVRNRKITFLFFNQNICWGYSKEPSQWDGSFEHPKHMLNLWVIRYLQFYAEIFC